MDLADWSRLLLRLLVGRGGLPAREAEEGVGTPFSERILICPRHLANALHPPLAAGTDRIRNVVDHSGWPPICEIPVSSS